MSTVLGVMIVDNFSSRVKDLRCKKGLSQAELANAFGISLRNYQRYELGERKPKFDLVVSLADFFSVSTDYLLGTDKGSDELKAQLLFAYGQLKPENRKTLVDMAQFLLSKQGTNIVNVKGE